MRARGGTRGPRPPGPPWHSDARSRSLGPRTLAPLAWAQTPGALGRSLRSLAPGARRILLSSKLASLASKASRNGISGI